MAIRCTSCDHEIHEDDLPRLYGIDRRAGFGPSETQRTPPRRGTPSFESDDSSVSLPAASQFSTDIEVEDPLPLGEK